MGAGLALVALLAAGDAFFQPSKTEGEFVVSTPVLAGLVRQEGRSIGLMPLLHMPTRTVLARDYGLLNYYRVFSGNRRFGHGMRELAARSRLSPEGVLEVAWPAAEDRPFELTAAYRWRGPETLDVTTRVRARAPLPGFEVFLASYMGGSFSGARVYAKPGFVSAEPEAGTWQMFPRDEAAAKLIRDGRWSVEPDPVDWTLPAEMAAPLIFRRGINGVTIILMAPPKDCFAVSTPCRDEPHLSVYLSLFGRDLAQGEEAVAQTRLVIATDVDEEAILKLYRDYLAGLDRKE